MNLIHRIKYKKPKWFYIQPGHGASLDTLVKRASYGGRKGRRAVLRINLHSCELLYDPDST